MHRSRPARPRRPSSPGSKACLISPPQTVHNGVSPHRRLAEETHGSPSFLGLSPRREVIDRSRFAPDAVHARIAHVCGGDTITDQLSGRLTREAAHDRGRHRCPPARRRPAGPGTTSRPEPRCGLSGAPVSQRRFGSSPAPGGRQSSGLGERCGRLQCSADRPSTRGGSASPRP